MKNSSEIGHDLNFSRYLLNRTWRLVPLVLLPLVVATFVFSGGGKITGDIEGKDYQRLYYHVLPVVLSAEFLSHPYDHTADNLVRQIVWSQPLDQSINLTIKKSIEEIKKFPQAKIGITGWWMIGDLLILPSLHLSSLVLKWQALVNYGSFCWQYSQFF